MYGSCKPYNEPYLITNHITFNINDDNEITEHNNRIDKDKQWLYTETLSIRNKDEESPYREDKKESIEKMEYAYQDQKIKRTIISKSQQSKENKKVTQSCSFELAEQLVDILSVDRADNYDSWIRVGWCCRNIDNRLLRSWITFSKKSSKFVDEDECEQAWRYMK